MAERIKLEVGGLQALRQMNPMLMSYNVELRFHIFQGI